MSEAEVVYESGTKVAVRYALVDGVAQVKVDDLDNLMLEIGYFNADD